MTINEAPVEESPTAEMPDPILELVPVGSLSVDDYVQRDYRPAWAQELADNWSVDKRGVFEVSRRATGLDHVIDGQHRRGAMLILGKDDELVPALIYKGLSRKQEARLFKAKNVENKSVTPIDVWRVSLVEEDPPTMAINAVLLAHGLHVSHQMDSRSVAAVGSLRWIFDRGGIVLLHRVLDVIEGTWGATNRDSRDGQLLKGLAKVLEDHTGGRLDTEALTRKLATHGSPLQLVGDARTYRRATGRAQWLEIAHVIVGIYNKGRTSGRIEL